MSAIQNSFTYPDAVQSFTNTNFFGQGATIFAMSLPPLTYSQQLYDSGLLQELTHGRSASIAPFKPLLVKTAVSIALFALGFFLTNRIGTYLRNNDINCLTKANQGFNGSNTPLNSAQLKIYFTSWSWFLSFGEIGNRTCRKLSVWQLHQLKFILSESAFLKVLKSSGKTLTELSQDEKALLYLNSGIWKSLSSEKKNQAVKELQGPNLYLLKLSIPEEEFTNLLTSNNIALPEENIPFDRLTEDFLSVLSFKALISIFIDNSEKKQLDNTQIEIINDCIAEKTLEAVDEPDFFKQFNKLNAFCKGDETWTSIYGIFSEKLIFANEKNKLELYFKTFNKFLSTLEQYLVLLLAQHIIKEYNYDNNFALDDYKSHLEKQLLSENSINFFKKNEITETFLLVDCVLAYSKSKLLVKFLAKLLIARDCLLFEVSKLYNWYSLDRNNKQFLQVFFKTLLEDEELKISSLPDIWRAIHIQTGQSDNVIEPPTKEDFQTLEVEEDSEFAEIRAKYICLQLEHHPDRNLDRFEEATKKTQEICNAYQNIEAWEMAQLQIQPGENPLQFAVDSFLNYVRNNKDRIAKDNPWPANEVPEEVSKIISETLAIEN